jgi:predicted phosphodiesterase
VLSDIHIPYHSIEALTIALDYGKEVGVNTIILNGDLIDCHHLSRFQKDPRKRHFSEERKMTREFLQTLRDAFPNAHIIYKCGNHDARLDKYVQQHAPELYGEKCAQLKHLLKLKNLNIAWVNDKRIIKVSGLNLAHGHELGGSSFIPVNPARSLFTKATANAMVGHHHRTSENTIKTLEGNMITTWSSGCLCELHPDFMPYNQHNHGFAHIRRDGDHFEVINKRINGNELF